MEVIQRTLENGLTVYLSPNKEEPRFYAEIITRAEVSMILTPTQDLLIILSICCSKELNPSAPLILKKKNHS